VVETYRTCRRRLRQLRRTCHLKTVTFLINDAGMMQLWVAIERIYTIYYNNIHTACTMYTDMYIHSAIAPYTILYTRR